MSVKDVARDIIADNVNGALKLVKSALAIEELYPGSIHGLQQVAIFEAKEALEKVTLDKPVTPP